MSGKPTPGPWRKSGAALDGFIPVMATGGVIVALISMLSPKAEDDARLIAGAPELLENAICARDTMSRAADIMEHVCGRRDDAERLRRGADVCRTLIAKATQP